MFNFREIFSILNKLNIPPTELRGIGIQISRLEKINKPISSNFLTKFLKNSYSSSNNNKSTTLNDNKNIVFNATNISKVVESKNSTNNSSINTFQNSFDNFIQPTSTIKTGMCSDLVKNKLKNMILSRSGSKSAQSTPAATETTRELSPVSEVAMYIANNEIRNQNNATKLVNAVKGVKRGRGRPKGIQQTKGRSLVRKNSNNGNLDAFLKTSNIKEV